ncbi:protein phosphatase 1 regulatory subunit 35 [Eucyclogobius newberryi]|uniref:protein phosphatase 1 regulatory subunit 35 n=1 Tax=Eucyclogobius newberryi TaxID=166745 RepID=UPI003B5CFA96
MEAPPSPLPPLAPLPCPLSPNFVSHCPLLDLSIAEEPHPQDPRPRPQSTRSGKVPAAQTPPLDQHHPIVDQRNGCLHGNGRVPPQPEASIQLTSGAELNTTLALRAELQSLEEAQWDAAKTLKENLEKNERTQTLINSRATHGVSFPRRAQLYSSLVSVHVSEGHVIRRAAVQRLPLAAAPKAPPLASTGPSLLPLTSNLYHRPLPLQPSPAPFIRPRPHSASFSLFQRQQRWSATF